MSSSVPTSYTILSIPGPPPANAATNPQWIALAEKFSEMRLESLKTAPEAYGSSYEFEAPRGYHLPLERFHRPNTIHFVAVWVDVDVDEQTPTANAVETDGATQTNDIDLLLRTKWAGMIVLSGPDADPPPSCVPPQSPPPLRYGITAMYVRPFARRIGLGAALIGATFAAAGRDVAARGRPAVINIGVNHGNEEAFRLYAKLGFRVVREERYRQRPRWVDGEMREVSVVSREMEFGIAVPE